MKRFKDFLSEEMMPFAQTEKGFVGVDNGPVRDNINIHLASVTARPHATPYHALEMVRKVLAPFSIFPPQTNFLDGDSGHEVFPISQFGNKMGMTNDGTVVVKNYDPYYVYFEYQMNDRGSFDIFCEIVEESELQEILDDMESEMEDGETSDGDEADAEDSFDEYKAGNDLKEDKDPCWDNYEMIGMKKKGGRKVPNCVPKNEEKVDESIAALLAGTGAGALASYVGMKTGVIQKGVDAASKKASSLKNKLKTMISDKKAKRKEK